MADTAAQTGKANGQAAFKKGNQQTTSGKLVFSLLSNTSRSLHRYHDFICTNHVQPAARSGFDSARIVTQLFDLST